MSKTIRLEDTIYYDLDNIREKRETFSEAVGRLIKVFSTMKQVSDTLGPSHYLHGRPITSAATQEAADRRGAGAEVPDL